MTSVHTHHINYILPEFVTHFYQIVFGQLFEISWRVDLLEQFAWFNFHVIFFMSVPCGETSKALFCSVIPRELSRKVNQNQPNYRWEAT